MNPNGLVAAASNAAGRSGPVSRATSMRLVDQHDVHGREGVLQQLRELRLLAPATGTTRCTSPEQKAAARSSDAASIPLTIFGVVVSVHIRLPGSIRSGLNPEANP